MATVFTEELVMYNDFVIVGPASDPAGVFKTFDVSEALLRIKDSKSLWFSRGDDSGTHKKEMELWRDAGVGVFGSWYRALGQGMGRTLMATDEKSGYTLTDRGSYIALVANGKVSLKIQGPRGGRLHNPYSVIAVNPKRHPHVKFDLAVKYIDFLTSGEGQGIIRDFRLLGKQLFYPNANKPPLTGLEGGASWSTCLMGLPMADACASGGPSGHARRLGDHQGRFLGYDSGVSHRLAGWVSAGDGPL